MRTTKHLYWGIAAAAIAAILAACAALQSGDSGVNVGSSDLGGVVSGASGPGGRRLGDRGDDRSAHEVRQDRGDR